MITIDRFSRRKVVGGCKLIAAHKEEGCGQVWLWCRPGSLYPYRVTTREATGEHITWRSALKEFKSLIGKNEVMIEMNQQEKFEALLKKKDGRGHTPTVEAEAEALDRAHRHKTWCNCEACQRIRKKEGSVQFNVKVKSWVKVELHKLGGKEVARRLEEMVKSL